MRLLRRIRTITLSLISVVFIVTDYIYLGIIFAQEFDVNPEDTELPAPTQHDDNYTAESPAGSRVLIYTQWRSGSSFLGDLFSSHPDVFYVFEPLKMFDSNTSKSNQWVKTEGLRHLDDVLRCNLTPSFSVASLTPGQHRASREFKKRFCRQRSCRNVSHALQNCVNSKYVVVKLIKIYNVDWFQPFMARGVKIVNLVRDPRSRFWSQINAKLYDLHLLNDAKPHGRHRRLNGAKPHDAEDSTESETENPRRADVIGYMRNRLPIVCKNNADDLRKSLTQVTKNRVFYDSYTLVRFEDLATFPYSTVHRLYAFLGIHVHPKVIEFITKTTSHSGPVVNDVYATRKDSRKVLEKWRREMPWDRVTQVQMNCSVVMEMLSYSPAVNESVLRDLSRELTQRSLLNVLKM